MAEMTWLEWEGLMQERIDRAHALDGLEIQVHSLATMTPYDPSAGDTAPTIYYLRHGWAGRRASMVPRWPPGLLGGMIGRDMPYAPHMPWVTRWILHGRGHDLPRDVAYEIWSDMARWIKDTLFVGGPSPTEQWAHWQQKHRGMFGPEGSADKKIITPWEKDKGQDAKIKLKASRHAKKYPEKHADVYSSRSPKGFLESMFDTGPVVKKP